MPKQRCEQANASVVLLQADPRPLDTLNPIKANIQHWSMLARDTRTTARWQDKLPLWFRPTGWRSLQ
ncbi:MAG: hypothetical protein COB25_006730 [Oceanospirillales bacterium]|uniref:hypothetical protein n=1 Tax=Marinobacter maritimus TaxID=277961 RepID=UPI0011A77D33|nr:hypothetical protein [Marinobacter maritimus]MBL1272126.1 hypothetical protein [Oceanospirillales bacterium]